MTIRRRALLIGVVDTPKAEAVFPPLHDAVRADLALMEETLRGSGYAVDVLGADRDHSAPDRPTIATAVERAAAEPCELLLVYFSGHGVRIGETDYLVPGNAISSARGPRTQAELESLLSVASMVSYLRGCAARNVLLVVDACREGTAVPPGGFGAGAVAPVEVPLIPFFGCKPEEVCHYDEGGSWFTGELAAALDPLTPERTLTEVFERTAGRTAGRAQQWGKQQHPTIPQFIGQKTDGFPDLCEGTEIPVNWRAAVADSRLWEERVQLARGDREAVVVMRDRIAGFAHHCAVSVLNDRRRFSDPWADLDLPVRVLRSVTTELLKDFTHLTPVEAGLLVALPFLREAMWARRLSEIVEADPFDLEPTPSDRHRSPTRAQLEEVHQAHPHLLRKARGHQQRGDDEAHRALAAWLAHQWVAEKIGDGTPGADELVLRLTCAILGADAPDASADGNGLVNELMWPVDLLAKGLAEETGDAVPPHPFRDAPESVTADGRTQQVRWEGVRGLARVAALLGADVRLFPDMLPDHVGVSDPLSPAEAVEALRTGVGWGRSEDLQLNMFCPHQALHECLEDLVGRTDRAVRELRGSADQQGASRDLLTDLPSRVTALGLKAKLGKRGERSYQVPVLRFRLAQDEIRELLMGHQLYGDRALAVRELYQNAADACRYRRLRWEYLRQIRKDWPEWHGRIVVTQGREEPRDGRPGRPYIECRDNGVGMGRAHLEQTFSRAGRRFSQTLAFRREQARWLAQDENLKLYPYSRFGIGVLSYFMIADDVTLVTREVLPNGTPADRALSVTISSSSGLFRIQPYDEDLGGDSLPQGGTVVRLMLSEPEAGEKPVSAGAVLERHVQLSEFGMEVREDGAERLVWKPGDLRGLPEGRSQSRGRIRLGAARRAGQPRAGVDGPVEPGATDVPVWWVDGPGALLADGIGTEERPFGYAANLSGPQAPKLSVNRNKLIDWDREWVTRNLLRAAESLHLWQGLDHDWLWRLEKADAELARAVVAELRRREVTLALNRVSKFWNHTLSVEALGSFSDDVGLLPEADSGGVPSGNGLTAWWRLAVLRALGVVVTGGVADGLALPDDVSGCATPIPGDAALLSNTASNLAQFVDRVADDGRPLTDVLDRLRRFAILGDGVWLPAVPPGAAARLDFVPDEGDEDLVRWMLFCADPEQAARYPAAAPLLTLSAAQDRTVGDLLKKCERYAPLGVVPPEVPERLLPYTATAEDVWLLTGGRVRGSTYTFDVLTRRVRAPHIGLAAHLMDLSPADVLRRLRTWEDLGYVLPAEEELSAVDIPVADWEWLTGVWHPEDENAPSRHELLLAAARRESTVSEVLAKFAEWGSLFGHSVPGSVSDTPSGVRLDSGDVALLTGAGEDWEGGAISLDHLALAYATGGKLPGFGSSPDDENWPVFVGRVAKLQALNVPVPADLEPLRRFTTLSPRDRIGLVVGSLDRDVPWTAATLVCTAGQLRESLSASRDRLAQHADGLGKAVPALTEEAGALAPTEAEAELLTEFVMRGGQPVRADWILPTPYAVASYARDNLLSLGQTLDRLEPYRALGALLPEVTAEQRALLDEVVPDLHDLTALCDDPDAKEPVPVSSLTPLQLLFAAARLGRPVKQVHRRLAHFEHFGLTVRASGVPDVVPQWQDFILLTEGLDGREPALSGEIDSGRIDALAAEVAADPAWVHERLDAYAEMFGLSLPDVTAARTVAAGKDDA